MFTYSRWLVDFLAKAAGHKYIKRVPYMSGGKRRYRYIYKVTHAVGGKHVLDATHMVVGAAFMLDSTSGKEVHAHIVSTSGDKVTYRLDDGPNKGKVFTVTRAQLASEINDEHLARLELTKEREKQAKVVADLRAGGASEKHVTREQARLDRLVDATHETVIEPTITSPDQLKRKDDRDPYSDNTTLSLQFPSEAKWMLSDLVTHYEGARALRITQATPRHKFTVTGPAWAFKHVERQLREYADGVDREGGYGRLGTTLHARADIFASAEPVGGKPKGSASKKPGVPKPVEPTPVEPTPVEPTPEPVGPKPVEPTPVEPKARTNKEPKPTRSVAELEALRAKVFTGEDLSPVSDDELTDVVKFAKKKQAEFKDDARGHTALLKELDRAEKRVGRARNDEEYERAEAEASNLRDQIEDDEEGMRAYDAYNEYVDSELQARQELNRRKARET